MKNVLLILLFFSHLFTLSCAMQKHEQISLFRYIPEEVSYEIFELQILDIHNQVKSVDEARTHLITCYQVSKRARNLINSADYIRTTINKLSTKFQQYEEVIAIKLNMLTSKKYITTNKRFFQENITIEDIQTIINDGGDINYRRCTPDSTDITSLSPIRNTPLLFHMWEEADIRLAIVPYLLKNGACVNRCAYQYPLAVAITIGSIEIIQLILSYNPIFRNNPFDRQNYLTQAIEKNDPKIIALLLSHPGTLDLNCALEAATHLKNLSIIKKLIKKGANHSLYLKQVKDNAITTKEEINFDILKLYCNYPLNEATLAIIRQDLLDQQERIAQALKLLPKSFTEF